jgi:hypothetical protein
METGAKFRNGESANRHWGGRISENPLPQAIYAVAASMDMKSQRILARALGKPHSTVVQSWLSGKSVPTPEQFGLLLQVLQPTDQELDILLPLYCEILIKRNAKETVATRNRRLLDQQIKEHAYAATNPPEEDSQGRAVRIGPGVMKGIQKSLPYKTYNGHQAATELGTSPQVICNKRKKFNLPLLITQDQLAIIKADLNPRMTQTKK